jgi:hypothetical protein
MRPRYLVHRRRHLGIGVLPRIHSIAPETYCARDARHHVPAEFHLDAAVLAEGVVQAFGEPNQCGPGGKEPNKDPSLQESGPAEKRTDWDSTWSHTIHSTSLRNMAANRPGRASMASRSSLVCTRTSEGTRLPTLDSDLRRHPHNCAADDGRWKKHTMHDLPRACARQPRQDSAPCRSHTTRLSPSARPDRHTGVSRCGTMETVLSDAEPNSLTAGACALPRLRP